MGFCRDSCCTIRTCVPYTLIAGIALSLGGYGGFLLINHLMRQGIIGIVVITSEDVPGWGLWQAPEEEAAYYMNYYMWNLTNAYEVATTGAKPVYVEMGPYVYQRHIFKFNVTWSEDENLMTRYVWMYFVFRPDLSNGTESDEVTNFNQNYLGTLSQSGGEAQMTMALTGPTLMHMLQTIEEVAIPRFIQSVVPLTLERQLAVLEGNGTSFDDFLSVWANGTQPDSDDWDGMVLALDCQTNCAPSNIPWATAVALFDPNVTLSLMSRDTASAAAWTALVSSPDNATAAPFTDAFGLSEEQVLTIGTWLASSFMPGYVVPFLLARYNVDQIGDLAYLQWGSGTVLPQGGVASLYPELFPFPNAEFGVWSAAGKVPPTRLSATVAKQFLNGTYGIFDPNNIAVLLSYVTSKDWETIYALWGVGALEAPVVADYVFTHMLGTYTHANVESIFANGGGLVTTRNVSQWLFHNVDPLLLNLQPAQATQTLQRNFSSYDDAFLNGPPPDTFYTGKLNTSQVAEYYKFSNSSEVDYWANPLYLPGYPAYEELGVFPPFMEYGQVLHPFDPNICRSLILEMIGEVSLLNITLWRYLIGNSSWGPDPLYFQSDAIIGFINVSSVQFGAPIYYSAPNMWTVPQVWLDKIEGMNPSYNLHATIVDVEPNTGKVMRARQTLQVNAFISPGSNWFNFYHPKMPNDIMLPLFWVSETAQLTEAQAQQFYPVQMALKARWIIGIGVGSLGGVLLLISFVLMIIHNVKRNRRRQYSPLN